MSDFREITIGGLLKETASKYPDNRALVYPEFGISQNYRDFAASCAAVAKGFMALGVRKGDHVSVWTTNLPQWVHMQFGLGMIGAVLVTVNTNYKSHELEYILRQSDSTTLVLMEKYRDTNYFDTVNEVVPGLATEAPGRISAAKLPTLKNIVYIGERASTPGMFHFDEVVKMGEAVSDAALEERMNSCDCRDGINMQYTSGTTGFPKGVLLSHYNIVNNSRMVGDVMGLTEKDSLLIHVPLFHCFGCVMSTLNSVYHGSTMVVMESFDPGASLKAIHSERCTAINGVPTMFIAMLAHPDFDKFDMKSLRTGIMAGAPCPIEVMNQVRTRMHCPEVVIAFGQTECSPVMTMTRRDDPVELRVSTVGRLLPDIEGRIINPDTGEEVSAGVQGEIVTRSDCVMKGYYKMPEETDKAVDSDGWLHTGDLGRMDADGYIFLTGRKKRMVITSGFNVYPREVEIVLEMHPAVAAARVESKEDMMRGEIVKALIVRKPGVEADEKEILRHCRAYLSSYKLPREVEFISNF